MAQSSEVPNASELARTTRRPHEEEEPRTSYTWSDKNDLISTWSEDPLSGDATDEGLHFSGCPDDGIIPGISPRSILRYGKKVNGTTGEPCIVVEMGRNILDRMVDAWLRVGIQGYKRYSEPNEYPGLNYLSLCATPQLGAARVIQFLKLVVVIWAIAKSELGTGRPNTQSPRIHRR